MLEAMTALSSHIIIDMPADTVWEVIAGRFDRIGDWATAIPASSAAPAAPGLIHVAAPIPARTCDTGIRMLPQVTETIAAFDPGRRTLTYQVTAGMPAFVTAARNTWTVTALDGRQCRVAFAGEFTTRGLFGRMLRPLLLARVARDGKHLLGDLKHFAETGTPSPRKLARNHPQTSAPG